jgi:general secretion pathway protein D
MGAPVSVQIRVENATDVFAVPLRLNYDPAALRLVDIQPGEFLSQGGQQVIFSRNIPADRSGAASANMNRVPGSGGASGSGTLVTVTFEPLRPGSSQVTVDQFSLRDTRLQPIVSGLPPVNVTIGATR